MPAKFTFKFKYAACGVASVSEPNYTIISDFRSGISPHIRLRMSETSFTTTGLTIFRLQTNEKC